MNLKKCLTYSTFLKTGNFLENIHPNFILIETNSKTTNEEVNIFFKAVICIPLIKSIFRNGFAGDNK